MSAAEQTDARTSTAAGTFSVRLLANHERHPDVAVLSVHGDVDLVTAPRLHEALARVLERQTRSVVVDLSEVSFMDSSGVHVLLEALHRLEPESRRLAVVCRDGGQVHRVLVLLGLLDALTVHRTRESAVTGGDDLLRPTQTHARAARGTGYGRTCSVGSASAGAWTALRGPRTDLAPAIH